MYKVFRKEGKVPPFLLYNFLRYESARSQIRKWIRETQDKKTRKLKGGWGELLYYNPSISEYGFYIKKI